MSESKANYIVKIAVLSDEVFVLYKAIDGMMSLAGVYEDLDDYSRDDLLEILRRIEKAGRDALSEVRK